ncbi:MAG: tRNA lysidine(34) synthetase TilS [Leptolinea sp.]
MELNFFKETCEKQCGLELGQLVLVGFSGGVDSLSLLLLMRNAGYPIMAAHFNHHLRAAADADEMAAKVSAQLLGVPFVSGGEDVSAVVREQKLSVEEAARQCRYRWLFEQARLMNAQAIAVGHTADDQVETVLMHLLRGAGLDGLRGMSFSQKFPLWDANIPIVRPLLSAWRNETEFICRQANLNPVEDDSNRSVQYFRNRIRLELIPYLQGFNPQVKPHILQTTRILAEEESILNQVKEEAWQKCFDRCSDRWISLHLTELHAVSEGYRRAVLRRAVWELGPERRNFDFEETLTLTNFVLSPTRSKMLELPGRIWAQAAGGLLILWKGQPGLIDIFPQIGEGKEYHLNINQSLDFPGWRIEIREDDLTLAKDSFQKGGFPYRVWLDAERLIFPLTVRSSLPGERIYPLGMGGKSQKISDYRVNRKVPRQARKNWPIIASGQAIVWIPGYGMSEVAAVTNQTRLVVQISLQFLDPQPDGQV